MILLNILLAGGLAAAAVPVVVHILHRRKVRHLDWGAMRFLHEMLARSRRRLAIEELLLLALRMACLACVALALTRPAIEPPATAEQVRRHGRTAAVILVDDSASTGAGRPQRRIAAVRDLVRAYLATLAPGDEVSLVRLSALGEAAADPYVDLDAARRAVEAIEPATVASDVPALIEAGLARLARHINPNVEVVLAGDGGGEGWRAEGRDRWQALHRRLSADPTAAIGTRDRPRLVLLAPPDEPGENLAVTGLRCDQGLIPVGRPVGLRVALRHRGSILPAGVILRLSVDGSTVAERPVALPVGGEREEVFQHRFAEAGSHIVEALLIGNRDDLPGDDRRPLAVPVLDRIPVLLAEGRPGPGLSGSLAFAALALAPEREEGAGAFACTSVSATALAAAACDGQAAVVLGDPAALDAAAVSACERLLAGGGCLIIAAGPSLDAEVANRCWWRGGDGFLPCPLQAARDLDAGAVSSAVPRHPAFAAFTGEVDEAWAAVRVRRAAGLDLRAIGDRAPTVLLRLADGTPLAVEGRRGRGRVVVVACGLDATWSDLPVQPAFFPFLRGLVTAGAGAARPALTLAPGDRLVHPANGTAGATALTGDGAAVPLTEGSWEGRPALVSLLLTATGVITVRDHADGALTRYAVAFPADEGLLEPLTPVVRDRLLAGVSPLRLDGEAAVRAALVGRSADARELWRFAMFAALLLLLAETWVAGRQAAGARAAAPGGRP